MFWNWRAPLISLSFLQQRLGHWNVWEKEKTQIRWVQANVCSLKVMNLSLTKPCGYTTCSYRCLMNICNACVPSLRAFSCMHILVYAHFGVCRRLILAWIASVLAGCTPSDWSGTLGECRRSRKRDGSRDPSSKYWSSPRTTLRNISPRHALTNVRARSYYGLDSG